MPQHSHVSKVPHPRKHSALCQPAEFAQYGRAASESSSHGDHTVKAASSDKIVTSFDTIMFVSGISVGKWLEYWAQKVLVNVSCGSQQRCSSHPALSGETMGACVDRLSGSVAWAVLSGSPECSRHPLTAQT